MSDFNSFKKRCIDILSQSDNCVESQKLFHSTSSYADMVLAWRRFFAGIIHEVPSQVIKAFDELYGEYKADLNRVSIFYNESPKYSSFGDIIIMGNAPAENKKASYPIYGKGRVYILGDIQVTAFDDVRVYCHSSLAKVRLYNHSVAFMDGGVCEVNDSASANGKGKFITTNNAIVNITGGSLDDYGHNFITAYNDSSVTSFTDKRIVLKDNAQLTIIT